MNSAALAIAAPLVAAMAGLTYATVAPTCSLFGRVISRGVAGSRRVALTFDDGPTPGSTEQVLDVLRDRGVRAAFFVVGVNAVRHTDLLRRIHLEGHLIGNHSFHHDHFSVMRRRRYWNDEVRLTDEAIESAVGVRPAMFRPPMGIKTWHTTGAASQFGHRLITWSRRAVDGIPTTPQRICRRFHRVGDGEILLLHDGVEPNALHADRGATVAAVGMLIDQLRQMELMPVRLDELLGFGAYQLRDGVAT
jgi:peptidoglycan/xylan/chitin deacetylase (PgdA/CDA1 family)